MNNIEIKLLEICIISMITMIQRNEKDTINSNCTYYILHINNNIRINYLSLFDVSSLAPRCNVSLALLMNS